MKKNVEGLVNEYLGDLIKFNIGLADNKYEFVVVYEDDYSLTSEYKFKYNKESEETSFGGNVSRSRFGKFRFDRNEEFEEELVQNLISAH